MVRSLIALSGAAAVALLLMSSIAGPAEARPGHHSGSYGGARSHGSYAYGGHRHFHRRIIVGVPFAYGAYYYNYGGCYWLRRRALETGSPYWWNRYEACVAGYYGY